MTAKRKSKRRAKAGAQPSKAAAKSGSEKPRKRASTAKKKSAPSAPSSPPPKASGSAAGGFRHHRFAALMAGLVVLTVAGLLRKWRANDELAGIPKKTPSTAAPTTRVQAPMPSAMGSSKAVLKLDRLWFNRSRLQQAILRFEKYLLPEAQRSEHPWALAHGLIAFGKDLVADNQKPAIDVIVLAAEAKQIEGRKRYVWPRRKDGRVIAPHKNMHVATMLDVGVPLDRWFRTSDDKVVRFERLVRDAVTTTAMPATDEDWHDSPWLFSTLLNVQATLGSNLKPKAPIRKLFVASLERLENDTRLLDPRRKATTAFAPGSALRQARDNAETLWAHSCGGLHLVQAAFYGQYALGNDKSARRIQHQLRILDFRFRAEGALYAAAERAAPENLMVRLQQLKFLGHLVETLTLARKLKLYPQGSRFDQTLIDSVNALIELSEAFARARVYERIQEVRKIDEQTYLDLVGDGCHALRAMRRALLAHDAKEAGATPASKEPN